MADPAPDLTVRPCFQQDLEMVQLIYSHYVLTSTATFESEPPSVEEMNQRWSEIVTKGWPFIVATPRTDLTRVVGYAYAVQFRPRIGYAQTFEDSVYVAPGFERRGAGFLLLAELLTMLKSDGVREVAAVIGDSDNAGSIRLHAKAGFRHVGTFNHFGQKFGRWLDVVLMQRTLGSN